MFEVDAAVRISGCDASDREVVHFFEQAVELLKEVALRCETADVDHVLQLHSEIAGPVEGLEGRAVFVGVEHRQQHFEELVLVGRPNPSDKCLDCFPNQSFGFLSLE